MWYEDADADGFSSGNTQTQCEQLAGYVLNAATGDCDDTDPAINPSALEVCDYVDNNCDAQIDEGVTTTFYYDADSDGYGIDTDTTQDCVQPAGYADVAGDCDDLSIGINPAAAEVCNDIDDNCDTVVDEGFDADGDGYTTCGGDCDDSDPVTYPGAEETCGDGLDNNCDSQVDEECQPAEEMYCPDFDGDGFGSMEQMQPFTPGTEPPGWLPGPGQCIDCMDFNPTVFPGAPEIQDGLDNDCNGIIDDGLIQLYYRDNDGDGYGNPAVSTPNPPPWSPGLYVTNDLDCNDYDGSVHPGANEVCGDSVDNNCNEQTDEAGCLYKWCYDSDHDGYGNPYNSTTTSQDLPPSPNHVQDCSDCSDSAAYTNPGAPEICSYGDNDCDGITDGPDCIRYLYRDNDADSYGNPNVTVLASPSTVLSPLYVFENTDCDDTQASINPIAEEICDGLDNNCDTEIDPGCTMYTYYMDADSDGYGDPGTSIESSLTAPPTGYVADSTDCNDSLASVYPDAEEVCDLVDNNCNSAIDEGFDVDGDGYTTCGGDCDDTAVATNPDATETCNQVDDNCDSAVDEGFDADGDGYTTCGGDCNDTTAAINPGVTEACNDLDDNCDGQVDESGTTVYYLDADSDGYGIATNTVEGCTPPQGYVVEAGDCNDTDASVNPSAAETCNTVDDNCDGSVDEGVTETFYGDADGDGYGSSSFTVEACTLPAGYFSTASDCDDSDPALNPDAEEICNTVDDNCDGSVDEGVTTQYWRDDDNDGYGFLYSVWACTLPEGYAEIDGDCAPTADWINPGEIEICDGYDNNCNGSTDEGVLTTYYRDNDSDGYGNPDITTQSCYLPNSYAELAGDCDDNSADLNPDATEICNGVDDNCDGLMDNGCLFQYHLDADGDGYGDPNQSTLTAETTPPVGYVVDDQDCDDTNALINPDTRWWYDRDDDGYTDYSANVSCERPPNPDNKLESELISMERDCNDNDPSINPAAVEVCDGIDNDCVGGIDDGFDNDGDGITTCNNDCDDTEASVYPDAPELCDDLDNNCDGQIDEGLPQSTFYLDEDSDGYGNPGVTIESCSVPPGYVVDSTDCDPLNSDNYPGAAEVCDEADNNCDGEIDEGVQTYFLLDSDGDGYGVTQGMIQACSLPEGYSDNIRQDCNDADPAIYPYAVELCDGIDNDCDNDIDDGFDQDNDGFTTCGGDCNDNAWNIYPGRTETCDPWDNNCDGVNNEGFDLDGDGYATCDGDCVDSDPTVHPDATDICNSIDDDCDSTVDEDCLTGITVDSTSFNLNLVTFTQRQLLVTGYYADGHNVDFTSSATGTVYTSSDTNVATVSYNGLVTAVNMGIATITVDNGGFSAIAAVSVVQGAVNYLPQPENTFGAFYEDLVPPDSYVEKYDEERFSIITGLVEDRYGSPVTGVSVSVHGHWEYGSVPTDNEGRFSMPVEGEGTMTVVYEKFGLLTSHRKVEVPWNDVSVAETITMIQVDSASTQVMFTGDPADIYTHKGTPTSDARGWRSLTAVISGDNRVYSYDEEGNQVYHSIVNVRATEYDTPESMPAKLPPNSAYTYCVEMGLDEAEDVHFEKPVTLYVDNFIGFEVGMVVPVGYYDRSLGEWVAQENGVIVMLLDTDSDGIVDALDADGDNQPDDLDADGDFSNEVAGLEDPAAYPPNTTFWRVQVNHFTPFDLNWPSWMDIPAGQDPSPAPSSQPIATVPPASCGIKPCENLKNSYIEPRSRTFHEDIPVPGTGITLHYASNRVEGYKSRIIVPASGSEVVSTMKRIIVELWIAGRHFVQELPPEPYQQAEFLWDGRDWRGDLITRSVKGKARIGYLYDVYFWRPYEGHLAFGQPGTEPTGYASHYEYPFEMDRTVSVDKFGEGTIARGWTLSPHHFANPTSPDTLILGDGGTLKYGTRIMDVIAGQIGQYGLSGMGGPAEDARIDEPHELATDGKGNVFINTPFYGTTFKKHVLKIDRDGIIAIYAGNGSNSISGDGGPAIAAGLGGVTDIVADGVGNLYIANYHQVRKVGLNGIINTIAGTGTAGYSGDGGPATSAQVNNILAIDVDNNGNLYIAHSIAGGFAGVIRKVDANGIITTYAGSDRPYSSGQDYATVRGDGGPALNALLYGIADIATDLDGNLYIATGQDDSIHRIDTSGTINHFAGNGERDHTGDGGAALEAALQVARMEIDPSGNLYLIGGINSSRLRVIDATGIISTVGGNRPTTPCGGNGSPASDATMCHPTGLTLDLDGNIYVSFGLAYVLSKVSLSSDLLYEPENGAVGYVEDSGIAHVVNYSGRHLKTIDTASGSELLTFGYDSENRIVSITDRFGNATDINRDGSGKPVSITSPDGITATLTIDGNGDLTRVTYPDGSFYSMVYTNDGLMTDEYDPNGNHYTHLFDGDGRLQSVSDQSGGNWTYNRTVDAAGNVTSSELSAEGDQVTYEDRIDSVGKYTSLITGADGSQSTFSLSSDGLTSEKQTSCGMDITASSGLDSIYGFKTPKSSTVTLPSGLSVTSSRAKTYADTNTDDILDRITDTVTVNGKSSTVVNDVLAGTVTATSPTGRQVTSYYSPATLLTSRTSTPGLLDTDFTYDTRGRLETVTVGTRSTSFAYAGYGYLDYMTTPDGRTFDYTYDIMGRLIAEDRPDGAQVDYSYDANGNVTAILNPNNIEHGFSYTANDQRESYNTPESGSYVYQYDRDRRLTSVMYPSGATITNTWATGQLQSTSTPEGLISYGYDCGGKLGSVSKGGESSFYTYDGSLLLIDTRAGTMNALIDYTYNSDLQVDSIGYAGASESFLYDGDGLLTDAGAYSITRDAPNGLPESVTDGTVTQARDFSSYGEVDGVDYTVGATAAYSWSVVRDNTGRITQKVENIGVDTVTWDYTYDLMGRLETVYKDSIMAEAYSYDGQGNRLEETNVLRGVSRTYTHDDEDKIVWAGLDAYMYDVDGFLTSRSIAAGADSGITTFDYSSRGELLSATLPDATVISYDHDPMGRRLAKRINGTITEKYLWQDAITLLAVYDGSDNLLQRFEYADGRMPVAMTSGGAVYYLAYDQVGSLKVVTDAAGTVVKRVDYDSFGNILNGSNSTFTVPFGFAGGLHDRDTGLVRFGARDYDSATGKWTAKDPIDFVGGDLNLLSYVGQDPVNWVDPLGLKIDWGNQVLSNLRLQANLVRLNQTIINLGYDDNCFTITLAGGDRQYGPNRKGWMFPDYLNNAWSVSTNKRVIQSHPYSAHFVDWGARSVDIALIGVRDTTFNMALLATEFDPKRTITYKDGHVHISLPKGKEYWAENYRYPVY